MKTEAKLFSAPEYLLDISPPSERGQVLARLAVALDRTIYSALLALIVLCAIPYGTVEPWWESCFEIIVFGLTALWIVEGSLSGEWKLSGLRLAIPLLVLTGFAFAQSIPFGTSEIAGLQVRLTLSADAYETQRFVLKMLALICAGLLMLRYVSNRRRLSLLIVTIVGVGIASAVFGLLRQTTQHEAIGFGLPFLRLGEGYAQFINRNHFAFLMEMTVGLAMGLVIGGGVRRDRVLIYLAAVAPLWTALVLSNSRGGIFGLLGQVLFLALLVGSARKVEAEEPDGSLARLLDWLGRSRLARTALALCLILVLAVSMIWVGGDNLVSRLETLPVEVNAEVNNGADGENIAPGPETSRGERRAEVWSATWSLIQAHPILGSGFGAYKAAIPAHHRASGEMTPQEAHNDYLELLSSGGIVGCLIVLWFAIALIRTMRERLRTAEPIHRAACYGAMTGLFGAAVHSLVDFGLHITANALIFTALTAIATTNLRDEIKFPSISKKPPIG